MKKISVTRILFVVSFLALGMLSYIFYTRLQALIDSYDGVQHATRVTLELEKTIGALKDAETGHHGYLLTHDPGFLESHRKSLREYPDHIARLRYLVADNVEQQNRLQKVAALAERCRESMEQTLESDQNGAVSSSQMLEVKTRVDDLHAHVADMIAAESDLLDSRNIVLQKRIFFTPLFLLVLTLVSLVILFFSFLHLIRQIKMRWKVQKSEQWLQQTVEERTRELQEKNTFNQTLLDASQEWIAVWDRNMRVSLLNDTAAKMMGMAKEEVIGKTLFELYPQAGETKSSIDLKRAMNGEMIRNEAFFSPLSERWIQNYLTPLKDKNGEIYAVLAIAQDVTEIVTSREELRKSQEHFSLLFQVSPVAKTLSQASDGTVIDVNPAWEKMFGRKRADVIGKNAIQIGLSTPEDRAENVRRIAANGGSLHGVEFRFNLEDGKFIYAYTSIVTIDLDGLQCYLSAYFDISERKAAEEKTKQTALQLAEKNAELEEAQRLAHIGSWEWEIVENRISWSDELYNIFGVSQETFVLVYENYLTLIHPDDRDRVHNTVQHAYQTLRPFDFMHRIVRPDGTTRTLHGRGEVIVDEQNNPVRMTGTTQDMTETALMTAALEQKNRELEKKNEELASFTYIASHDLQEPLRKIQTFTKRISDEESASLSEKAKDYFARIEKAVSRMQRLILDLLNYSRTADAVKEFEKVELSALLEDVLEHLKEKITATHTSVHIEPLPQIHAIPYQIQQLLTNIIANAIKFARPDVPPEIHISATVFDAQKNDEAPDLLKRKYHRITIADNGIGFEPSFNERIFGLFQRLHGKSEYEGTGIGLAICKKIMENHSGTIIARGEKGQGARFIFFLPIRG